MRDGRFMIGHYDGPLTVDPSTSLVDMALAASVLGVELHVQLVDRDPVRRLVRETIKRHQARRMPKVRWP